MFYTKNVDPLVIARIIINLETGFMFFEDDKFTQKPKQINIMNNADDSSTIIYKLNTGYLYLPEDYDITGLGKAIDSLMLQHPELAKVYDIHHPISLSEAVGYTSLKVKFKTSTTERGNILTTRSFIYGTPNKNARFNWIIEKLDMFLHKYMVDEDNLTKRIMYNCSILVDDGIFNETEGFKNNYQLTYNGKFTMHKLHHACNIVSANTLHSIIRQLSGYKYWLKAEISVPIYDNIEISDITADCVCLNCSTVMLEKYYIMIYGDIQHQICKHCAHKAEASMYINNNQQYVLCYDKPDKILIANIASSVDEIISKLHHPDIVKDFLIDYNSGNIVNLGKCKILVGKKKWVFGTDVLYDISLRKKIFIDDGLEIMIIV